MIRLAFLLVLLAATAIGAAQAQYDSAIFLAQTTTEPAAVVLFDSVAGKITSIIAGAPPQAARGGMFGPRGKIYMSAWGDNAIAVLDPATGLWLSSLLVKDPTNSVMGAPYQPAPNYDNLAGFGVFCIDGNPAPSTILPAPSLRNTFVVDFALSPPTFAINGLFSSVYTPMADFYPNLFNPGHFIGVGYGVSDQLVIELPYLDPNATTVPQFYQPRTVARLLEPSNYDATWVEDGNLYVFSRRVHDNVPIIQVVDVRTGTVSTLQTAGLPPGFDGAFWCAPWEKPGRKAFICCDQDDTIYAVDLLTNPVVATGIVKLPSTQPLWAVNSGRSAEEAQLSSWWNLQSRGQRNFRVNFGPAAGGQTAILVPSLSGLAPAPLKLAGLEIHLAFDSASMLGLQGVLPYTATTTLGATGEADFQWNGLGTKLGIAVFWQAVTIGKVNDASNIINVTL